MKDKHELKRLLRECHDKGYLTEEFAIEASLKACIYIAKKDRTYCHQIKEEALSHFCYKLVRKWDNLDPDKSPFTYINQMAYTSLLDVYRKEDRYNNRKKAYLEVVKGKLNVE